jgi:hypothetical protein
MMNKLGILSLGFGRSRRRCDTLFFWLEFEEEKGEGEKVKPFIKRRG